MKVGVIDYGVGNLGSVVQALYELRAKPVLINVATDMRNVDCMVLPGVGNFADCKKLLDQGSWTVALRDEVIGYNKPILGVCLGMQLLADASTEGAVDGQITKGLGFIPGVVEHLSKLGSTMRVPHVGWNSIVRKQKNDPLLVGIPDGTDFYFVHSYAFLPQSSADILAITEYGVPVPAVIRRGNVCGAQFHPEKSSKAGLRLLKNFIEGL